MPKGRGDPNAETDQNMIDKSISFEKRDMHKAWPMVKGCGLLIAGLIGFIYLSIYVFKNFSNWF
ncbi:MAG TPA: hypothetical protein VKX17_02290 [Planctomycetota bacterium]|nr:hypothetical protein [Planctomycetota bacterium]